VSYDRTWEARKVWGGITNASRAFGTAVDAFVQGENADKIKKELIYRHIAWLTALRYQLRLAREWEHTEERIKGDDYMEANEQYFQALGKELAYYIAETEVQACLPKANVATQILAIQGKRFQELKDLQYFEDFRHMEFHKLISLFYDEQGRSERIKNFPFPRQYASVALWQTVIFSALIPFGMLSVFVKEMADYYWLAVPFSTLLIWSFFLMEKIGDYSENPFEGYYNDVPICSIARGIEIDLREMINDQNIPAPIKSENGLLM
jgi:putative membrane protein